MSILFRDEYYESKQNGTAFGPSGPGATGPSRIDYVQIVGQPKVNHSPSGRDLSESDIVSQDPKRRSEINEQLEQLEKNVAAITEELSALYKRLIPILPGQTSNGGDNTVKNNPNTDVSTVTPMGNRIQNIRCKLSSVLSDIRTLNNELRI